MLTSMAVNDLHCVIALILRFSPNSIALLANCITVVEDSLDLYNVRKILSPSSSLPLLSKTNGWGAMSENRSKIGDFAATRSLSSKISDTRGIPPPIIFVHLVRPMNALQLCRREFPHSCYGWGATSENRSKIGDFAATRSLWSKISGARGRPHQSFLHS